MFPHGNNKFRELTSSSRSLSRYSLSRLAGASSADYADRGTSATAPLLKVHAYNVRFTRLRRFFLTPTEVFPHAYEDFSPRLHPYCHTPTSLLPHAHILIAPRPRRKIFGGLQNLNRWATPCVELWLKRVTLSLR